MKLGMSFHTPALVAFDFLTCWSLVSEISDLVDYHSSHRAISLSPDYPAVLQRLKSGNENFLDLGCCFGQELRKVAADGVVQKKSLWL
jgi:hypothetical protein